MISLPKQLQNEGFKLVLVKTRDKIPLEKAWTTENNYAFDDPKLLTHLANGGNYGVLTGVNDGIVVDADDDEIAKLVRANLPKTLEARTGRGGTHFYFVCPGGIKTKPLDRDGKNLGHVKAAGGFVVGPGSTHPNGNQYEISEDREIARISEEELRCALSEYYESELDAKQDAVDSLSAKPSDDISFSLASVLDLNRLQSRGSGKYQGPHPIHGSETGSNFTADTNTGVCRCWRHNCSFNALTLFAMQEGLIQCGEKLRGDAFKKTKALAIERGLLPKPSISELANEINFKAQFFDKTCFLPTELAKHLMKERRYRARRENSELYGYNDAKGAYENVDAQIASRIQEILGNATTTHRVTETRNALVRMSYDDCEEPSTDLILLQNGIYNWKTKETLPFSPNYFFVSRLPFAYDPEAKAELFEQKLKEILPEQKYYERVLEWFAYNLIRENPFKKMLICVGSGNNGKTVLVNVLIAFLGQENVSSITLQQLAEDRFAGASLSGRLANICDDLPQKPIQTTGTLKMFTGHSRVWVQKKGKDGREIDSYAKLCFTANSLPRLYDETSAMWTRPLMVMFKQQFTGATVDKFLTKKLTTPEMLSGIFNLVIPKLVPLIERNTFFEEEDEATTKNEYKRYSDPISAFIADKIIVDSQAPKILRSVVFSAFTTYCKQKGLIPVEINWFGRRLIEETSARPEHSGNNTTYRGIALREDDDAQGKLGGDD